MHREFAMGEGLGEVGPFDVIFVKYPNDDGEIIMAIWMNG